MIVELRTLAKHDFGSVTGKCEICTINLWDSCGSKPAVWPCNVKDCPYEDAELQHSHFNVETGGGMGSGLGQIEF
jgi:hypothetical protein